MSRSVLAAAFGVSVWAAIGQAQPVTKANTVDDTGGALAGQPMPGLIVMGQSCTFGDTYHYQVTSLGELRLEGPISCPTMTSGSKVNGNELICRFEGKLRCSAKPTGGAAPIDFTVGDSGVKVGDDKTYAWADQQQAAALLPLIRQGAEKKKEDQ